jgi:hypothetical protein
LKTITTTILKKKFGKDCLALALVLILGWVSSSLFSSANLYANITIELSIDKKQLTLEDELTVQVIVQGASDLDNLPDILNTQKFQVQESGSSSQITVINGDTTIQKIFNFILRPTVEGVFNIGPARVALNGQTLISNAAQVQVTKSTAVPQSERPFYIESVVDNKTPYLGEQMIYTFRLFRRVNGKIVQDTLPEFKSFWKEALGQPKEYRINRGGVPWIVSEFKMALFPMKSGPQSIERAEIIFDAILPAARGRMGGGSVFDDDSFFGMGGGLQRKRVRMTAEPIAINAKALPPAAEGNIADTGLVGPLEIKASLSKKTIKVGESATLTLTVQGEGNLRRLKDLELDWSNVKTYDDKPTFESSLGNNGKMLTTKTIKKAIVPLQEGPLTLPPIKLSYFDPKTGTTKETSTPELHLTILPSDEKSVYVPSQNQALGNKTGKEGAGTNSAPGASDGDRDRDKSFKKDIAILGRDLVGIERNLEALVNPDFTLIEKILAFVILLIGPLFFFFAFNRQRTFNILRKDKNYLQREHAYRQFKGELNKVFTQDKIYQEASKALRVYLGHKLDLEGNALFPIDVNRILAPKGVSAPTIESIKQFLSLCDQNIYGGASLQNSLSPTAKAENQNQLKTQLESIVQKVEKEIKS